ncbi:MAG: hypothetical protein CL927_16010 [Deltaproteobacteria bacterium]|nr:hypothetical protein [Deltaproteobacteria bacterium]HCH64295.1 hypothetical protein [Deltaproteobacteria bacterium]
MTRLVRTPQVYALGDPGALPFLGHFRAQVSGPRSQVRVAGRWGMAGDAVEACAAAARMEHRVRSLVASVERPDDRVVLLVGLWAAIAEEAAALAASLTADLAVVCVAADARGVSVTGVGLAGCWFESDRQPPQLLVPFGHPLMSPLGVPRQRPGAMTLNATPDAIYAELRNPLTIPRGLPDTDLREACGVRS